MSGLSLWVEIYKLPCNKSLERHQLPLYRDIGEAEAGTRGKVEQGELTIKKMKESRVHLSHSFLLLFFLIFKVKMHLLQKF